MSSCLQCGSDVPEGYGLTCPICDASALKRLAYHERQRSARIESQLDQAIRRLRDLNYCDDCVQARTCKRTRRKTGLSWCQHWESKILNDEEAQKCQTL